MLALFGGSVLAGEVYTWKNPAGMTVFSDRPPVSGTAEVTMLPLPGGRDHVEDANSDDYFSVINQAQRMESARRERAAAVLEQRRVYAEILRARNEARQAAAAQYRSADVEQCAGCAIRTPLFPYRPGWPPAVWLPQPAPPVVQPPSYGRFHQ
jgi:hypothetical protein